MSTLVWCIGFALMMGSFSFLFARGDEPHAPRISVDTWPLPERRSRRRRA